MADKQPKAAVNYRKGGNHCHACRFFSEDEGSEMTGWCEKVQGKIGEHMLCDLFKPMRGRHEAMRKRGLISDKAMGEA